MTLRSVFAVATHIATIACASGAAQDDVAHLTWATDTLRAVPRLLRDNSDSLFGVNALVHPLSVRAGDDLVFVANVGDDRIAVLDSSARVVRWIGTRGRGPGELYGASHLTVRDGFVFVGEALNGRVSQFTFDGRFVRSYVSPYAAGHISATQQDVLSASRSETHYAIRLKADEQEPSPALKRARPVTRKRRERWQALPGHDLVASDSLSTWVLDQGDGRLCRYLSPHSAGNCALLPPRLLARLREYRDDRVARIEAATRLFVAAAPLAKDMVRIGPWVALLLPLPEMPIVLIDVDDGTLTPVMLSEHTLPGWLRTARSFAWDGAGFVVVSDDAIGRLYISRRPPSE